MTGAVFIVAILVFRRGIAGTLETLMLVRRAPADGEARTGEPAEGAASTSR